jgi:hypothetical protein
VVVIVASAADQAARALAEAWKAADARVLTPLDLSMPGWHYRSCRPEPGMAVVDGKIVPSEAISGVVTRLPWIAEAEIPHVAEHDRAYVASEMQAFLFAWLSRLTCPVLNRPTPFCLAGPAWRHEKWISVAGRLGIRVRSTRRTIPSGSPPKVHGATGGDAAGVLTEVTVVAGRVVGPQSRLVEPTRQLAAAAGVRMITACYANHDRDAELVGVSQWPDITSPSIRDAMLRCVTDEGRAG